MGNETPSTAFTTPSSVKKWVFRFLMSIRTSPFPVPIGAVSLATSLGSLQSRVHGVAQPVADEVEHGHGDEDGESGEYREPPLLIVRDRDQEDRSPAGRRRADPEPEDGQCRLGDDGSDDAEGNGDEGRRERVR